MSETAGSESLVARARELDAADELGDHRSEFLPSDGLVAYLDGNSLGRPLVAAADRMTIAVRETWANRLIRGWDEGWYDLPLRLGDRLGHVVLGAAPGQTVIADSTTVALYKLLVGALELTTGRDEIVVDTRNFPTDRFIAQSVADAQGARLRWIDPDPVDGVTADDVRAVVGPSTAVVLLSQVDYRSGALADVAAITEVAHEAGAVVLWDVCHSAGALPIELDAWQVDLAVGCTYKYLNGGPGSPAFAYVAHRHLARMSQPIPGWMSDEDPFVMRDRRVAAGGIRAFLSGTPHILGTVAMEEMLSLIERAGISAIRAKSVALTEFALEIIHDQLTPLGVTIDSPLDSARRGSHVSIGHPRFRDLVADLWRQNVIPDFRPPDSLRIGLSPLSTSFVEVWHGLEAIRIALQGPTERSAAPPRAPSLEERP